MLRQLPWCPPGLYALEATELCTPRCSGGTRSSRAVRGALVLQDVRVCCVIAPQTATVKPVPRCEKVLPSRPRFAPRLLSGRTAPSPPAEYLHRGAALRLSLSYCSFSLQVCMLRVLCSLHIPPGGWALSIHKLAFKKVTLNEALNPLFAGTSTRTCGSRKTRAQDLFPYGFFRQKFE